MVESSGETFPNKKGGRAPERTATLKTRGYLSNSEIRMAVWLEGEIDR